MARKAKTNVRSVAITRCDGCSVQLRVGEEVLFVRSGGVERGPNDIKRASVGNLLGVFCRRCCRVVMMDVVANISNPGRISLGIPNHTLAPYLADLIRKLSASIQYRHVEVERLNQATLLVRVLPFDSPEEVAMTYDIKNKVLVQVPSRRESNGGGEANKHQRGGVPV